MVERKPEFFKVFFPQNSSEFLKIPSAFEEHIGSGSLGVVSLKGPSGNAWNVELVNNSDGFQFQKGWKEFVSDHAIEMGDFLVFRLDKSSCFSVTVFDKTACLKRSALVSTPCLGVSYNFLNSNTISEQNKADTAEDEMQNPHIKQYFDFHETKKRNGYRCPTANEPKLKKIKIENLETETYAPQTIDMSQKMSGRGYIDQCNKNSESDTTEPTDSQRRGRVLLSIQKIPSLLSQRRVITKEEANNTVQRAKSFKSKNPCCLIVMHGSNVYTGFYLNIPGSLAKYLPKISRKMTLWDPQGKPWEVTYLIHNEHAALSGGWGAFSLANNLEESDVCIFELVRRNYMKVHIFRVVEDIKPLIPKDKG